MNFVALSSFYDVLSTMQYMMNHHIQTCPSVRIVIEVIRLNKDYLDFRSTHSALKSEKNVIWVKSYYLPQMLRSTFREIFLIEWPQRGLQNKEKFQKTLILPIEVVIVQQLINTFFIVQFVHFLEHCATEFFQKMNYIYFYIYISSAK